MARYNSPKPAMGTALPKPPAAPSMLGSDLEESGAGLSPHASLLPQSVQQQSLPSSSVTDYNALLSRVAATHDRASFVALFDHFAPRIKGYLMQGGFPESEAEEIAQETMLQVWQKAEYFDPERAAASTWIYTIARNKKIDRLRKHRPIMLDMDYLMQHDPSHDAMIAGQGNDVTPDMVLDQQQMTQRLTDALQDLPEEQAILVRKAFFEDMSHNDIATKMHLPLGTVKSRLRSGLARLRKALNNKGDDSTHSSPEKSGKNR